MSLTKFESYGFLPHTDWKPGSLGLIYKPLNIAKEKSKGALFQKLIPKMQVR